MSKSLTTFFSLLITTLFFVACTEKETVEETPETPEAAAPEAPSEPAEDPAPETTEPEEASAAPEPTDNIPVEVVSLPGGGAWPQWGRDASNNMMSPATGLPTDFTSGEFDDAGEAEGAKHLKWVTEMGSQAYGTATVKDGRVFIGTNNEKPRIATVEGDHGIVMCFDEATGELLWQFSIPKLNAGKVSDWEFLGVCSSVIVDGKYGYVVTNRGEIICLDVYGMSDGNDGPFKDEAKYQNGGLEKLAEAEPAELDEKSADIVWGYDMRSELGVFP
ncbi:MAG: hypothetical protein AAF357_12125, partial [Verrucomicrobiota bacterium]